MSAMTDWLAEAASAQATVPQAADSTEGAIMDAALRQFELFGVDRSTMDDIARRAKLSRVTIYRKFPSKNALAEAVMMRELLRFLSELDSAVTPINNIEEMVSEGFVFTLESARSHRLLQRILESEPESLLASLTINGAPFIAAARDFLAARLAREFDDDRGDRELLIVSEIVVRLILSFLLTPQASVDLDDPTQARAFAKRYVQPLLAGD